MKRTLTYLVLALLFFTACEEIYIPETDSVENAIVVEARLVNGSATNVVRITGSKQFNETNPKITGVAGAAVSLVDENGNAYPLKETQTGVFPVQFKLTGGIKYKLKINHNGDEYESQFESVPKVPEIDTVYGEPGIKVIKTGGTNNIDDFREVKGVQLYADIRSEKELPYYKFTARKVLQYTYQVLVIEMGSPIEYTMYGWHSFYPQEPFNIAAPPIYSRSTDIVKHPLFFMEQKAVLEYGQQFMGWILILYQHGLTKSGYDYYSDLNNQLDAEGRLFDPLYVQARNNLKCISDPEKLILGNFEISNITETRWFVMYISEGRGYVIKPIRYFYNITEAGEQLNLQPVFWEYETKRYPND